MDNALDMDIPQRLERVRRMERDGVKWIHAQDYLRAIRAPARASITSAIARSEKRMVNERRGRHDEVKVLYITPKAAKQLATDWAMCPNVLIRAWIDGA